MILLFRLCKVVNICLFFYIYICIFFFMCDMSHHYIITRPCRFWLMCAATIMLIKSAFLVPQKARSPPSHTTPFFQLFSHTSRQLNLHIVAFFPGDKNLINARVHGSGPLTTANLLLRFSVKEAWAAPAVPSSVGRTTPMHRHARHPFNLFTTSHCSSFSQRVAFG